MKKPRVIISLLVICQLFFIIKANSNQKDSLLKQLPAAATHAEKFALLQQLYEASWRDNYYEAEKYILTALGIATQTNDYRRLAISYKHLAELYEQQGMPSRAYIFYLEARKIATDRNYQEELPAINLHIGILLYQLDRFEEAITFFDHTIALASTQQQSPVGRKAVLHRALSQYRAGEQKVALHTIAAVEDSAVKAADPAFLSYYYFQLQKFYNDIRDYERALELNTKACALYSEENDRYHVLLCNKDRAAVYAAMGNPQRSIALYRQLLAELNSLRQYTWLQSVITDSLSVSYEKNNDATLSRYYKKKSEKLADSLMLSVQNLPISIVAQGNGVNRKKGFASWENAVVLVLLFVMATMSIIIHRRYKKIKYTIQKEKEAAIQKARQMMEQEQQTTLQRAYQLIEEEKEMMVRKASEMAVREARAIIEKAREEARMLQAEVTTTSVLLANKNDYLLQLQEKLKTSDSNDNKRLAKEIKSNLGDTDYWANYVKNFNVLHSQVIDRIRQKHPDLTPNEIKLVCFVISGLSNKEIANIFSVEPESVKKARYRLKKKLHLKEEENLNFYLHSMQ